MSNKNKVGGLTHGTCEMVAHCLIINDYLNTSANNKQENLGKKTKTLTINQF